MMVTKMISSFVVQAFVLSFWTISSPCASFPVGNDGILNNSRLFAYPRDNTAKGSEAQYAHGNDNVDRQALLNSIFGPTSKRALVKSGIVDGCPKRVLEIGCGAGATTQMLADMLPKGSHVTGIDTSADMIQAAKKRFDQGAKHGADQSVELMVQSAEDLASQLQKEEEHRLFDAIWIRFVVVHVPDPVGLLRAACACLKPGGTMLIEDVDAAGVVSDPPLFGSILFHEAHKRLSLSLGGDLERGRKIGGYLREIASNENCSSPLKIDIIDSFVPLFGRGFKIDDDLAEESENNVNSQLTGDRQSRQEIRYQACISLIEQSLMSLSPRLIDAGITTPDKVDAAHDSLRVASSSATAYQLLTLAGGSVYQWSVKKSK